MSHIFESIIFGPDIYMFMTKSEKIKKLRNNLMVVDPSDSYYNLRNKTAYSNDMIYKQALVLPSKMNKRLDKFKKEMEFDYNLYMLCKDRRLDIMLDRVKNPNLKSVYINNKLGDLNLRYDMSPTVAYRVESVVRGNALMSKRKGIMYSEELAITTVDDFIRKFYKKEETFNMFDNHPMKLFYEDMIETSDFISDNIYKEKIRSMGKHSKIRKVNFQDITNYPNMSVAAIMSLLREDPAYMNKRSRMRMKLIEKFYSFTGSFTVMDMFIKLKEKDKAIASNIMTMIRNMSKITETKSLFFPFEATNSANYKINLMNLYKYRSNSKIIYEVSDSFKSNFYSLSTQYEEFSDVFSSYLILTDQSDDTWEISRTYFDSKEVTIDDYTLRDNYTNQEYIYKGVHYMINNNLDVFGMQSSLMKKTLYAKRNMKIASKRDRINYFHSWIDNYRLYIMIVSDKEKKFNIIKFDILKQLSEEKGSAAMKNILGDMSSLISKGYSQDRNLVFHMIRNLNYSLEMIPGGMIKNYGYASISTGDDNPFMMKQSKNTYFWSMDTRFYIEDISKPGKRFYLGNFSVFKIKMSRKMSETMALLYKEMENLYKAGKVSDKFYQKYKVFSLSKEEVYDSAMNDIEIISAVMLGTSALVQEEESDTSGMMYEEDEELEEGTKEGATSLLQLETAEERMISSMKGVSTTKLLERFSTIRDQMSTVFGSMNDVMEEIMQFGKLLTDDNFFSKEKFRILVAAEREAAQRSTIIEAVYEKVLSMMNLDSSQVMSSFISAKTRIKKTPPVGAFRKYKANPDDYIMSRMITNFKERFKETETQWEKWKEIDRAIESMIAYADPSADLDVEYYNTVRDCKPVFQMILDKTKELFFKVLIEKIGDPSRVDRYSEYEYDARGLNSVVTFIDPMKDLISSNHDMFVPDTD
jgi:hypothetical protein